jgi:hypothetical protein
MPLLLRLDPFLIIGDHLQLMHLRLRLQAVSALLEPLDFAHLHGALVHTLDGLEHAVLLLLQEVYAVHDGLGTLVGELLGFLN